MKSLVYSYIFPIYLLIYSLYIPYIFAINSLYIPHIFLIYSLYILYISPVYSVYIPCILTTARDNARLTTDATLPGTIASPDNKIKTQIGSTVLVLTADPGPGPYIWARAHFSTVISISLLIPRAFNAVTESYSVCDFPSQGQFPFIVLL